MSLAATILAMQAAGCSAEQMARVAAQFKADEDAKADLRRQKERDKKRAQRAKASPTVPRDTAGQEGTRGDTEGHGGTETAPYKENHTRADGNLNPLTTFGDIITPSPTDCPPKPLAEPKRKPASPAEFDRFYAAFPRHTGRKAAIAKFEAAVRAGTPAEHIIAAAARYAEAIRRAGTEPQFIPHPATWLHQGRYDDEDLPQPVARAGPAPRGRDTGDALARALIEGYRNQQNDPDTEADGDHGDAGRLAEPATERHEAYGDAGGFFGGRG